MISRPGTPGLHCNTPSHLKPYNIKISSRLQQFYDRHSESSCKKTPKKLNIYVEKLLLTNILA
jgi:hypothetical protein